MRNRNLFVFLSLLSMPTGYLCAAAESAEGRARREAQEAAERRLVNHALATDASGFSEDDMQRAKAQSLGLDDTEEEVKVESAGVVAARAANVPITMGDLQKANKERYMPNAATEIKKPTTERGKSIVEMIACDIVLPKEIAGLIENYEKPIMKEGTIKVEGAVNSIALSPVSYIIASAVGCDIRLYDAEDNTLIKMLKGHTCSVSSVAFSLDGKYIVSGSWDHAVRIWNVVTGECLNTVRLDDIVKSVVFSPDGQYIVSGSSDNKISIWSVVTGECLNVLQGHENTVFSVAFSSDGKYIVSGSGDNMACIWNVETGKKVRSFQHDNAVYLVAFSLDGRYIVSGSGNTVCIWNVATGECLKKLQHNYRVSSVTFSPDGQYIVSGSEDSMVRIWHVLTGECLKILERHENEVSSIAFSPCGQYIVSGSRDNTVRTWDIAAILAAQNQEARVLPDEDDKKAGEEAGEGKMEVARELEEALEVAVEAIAPEAAVDTDQEYPQEPLTPEQLRAARLAYFESNKQ